MAVNNDIITLGIESSCDETSIAVIKNGREVLSNIISSQIDIHKEYGGVVPEIASRKHLENINFVLENALKEAGVSLKEIDLIGVTRGPGLIGALLIGVTTAKALAFALNKPLVGVQHIQGHVAANYIAHKELEPPFVGLIVSGGHTSLVMVGDYNEMKEIGSTRDDAIGEAYDKVARVLDLGYPGGPKIDALAKEGREDAIHFKRVLLEKGNMDFSFSGVKTGVINYLSNQTQKGRSFSEGTMLGDDGLPISKADVAASFQRAVLDVVVEKALEAVKAEGIKKIAMCGGVAANSRLRELMDDACKKRNIKLYYPPLVLCTDNGAMIGASAHFAYLKGRRDGLDMDANANFGGFMEDTI